MARSPQNYKISAICGFSTWVAIVFLVASLMCSIALEGSSIFSSSTTILPGQSLQALVASHPFVSSVSWNLFLARAEFIRSLLFNIIFSHALLQTHFFTIKSVTLSLHKNNFTGNIDFLCANGTINLLTADCLGEKGQKPEVECSCCTACCNDKKREEGDVYGCFAWMLKTKLRWIFADRDDYTLFFVTREAPVVIWWNCSTSCVTSNRHGKRLKNPTACVLCVSVQTSAFMCISNI